MHVVYYANAKLKTRNKIWTCNYINEIFYYFGMEIYVADFMTLFGAHRLYKKIILVLIVYCLE